MPGEKSDKEEVQATIEYIWPEEIPEFYANGARIRVMFPFQAILSFFGDSVVDELAEQQVVLENGVQETKDSKKTYEGPVKVKRKIKVNVTMPIPTFISLSKVLTPIAKKAERDFVNMEKVE